MINAAGVERLTLNSEAPKPEVKHSLYYQEGEGCPAGGFVINAVGAERLTGGACLVDALVERCPVLVSL